MADVKKIDCVSAELNMLRTKSFSIIVAIVNDWDKLN